MVKTDVSSSTYSSRAPSEHSGDAGSGKIQAAHSRTATSTWQGAAARTTSPPTYCIPNLKTSPRFNHRRYKSDRCKVHAGLEARDVSPSKLYHQTALSYSTPRRISDSVLDATGAPHHYSPVTTPRSVAMSASGHILSTRKSHNISIPTTSPRNASSHDGIRPCSSPAVAISQHASHDGRPFVADASWRRALTPSTDAQHNTPHYAQPKHSVTPPTELEEEGLVVYTSRSKHRVYRRGGGAWNSGVVYRPFSPTRIHVIPDTLSFDSWFYEGGKQQQKIHIDYDTVKKVCTISIPLLLDSRITRHEAEVDVDPWELHVGAKLKLLGKCITIRKARDQATIDWLDQQAHRLREQCDVLREHLIKYRPVAMDSSISNRGGAASSACTATKASTAYSTQSSEAPRPVCAQPSGGQVNLKPLYQEMMNLARTLRMQQAQLPPLISPDGRRIDIDGMMKTGIPRDFSPETLQESVHARQEVERAEKERTLLQAKRKQRDEPFKRMDAFEWLARIPLAASAAALHYTPATTTAAAAVEPQPQTHVQRVKALPAKRDSRLSLDFLMGSLTTDRPQIAEKAILHGHTSSGDDQDSNCNQDSYRAATITTSGHKQVTPYTNSTPNSPVRHSTASLTKSPSFVSVSGAGSRCGSASGHSETSRGFTGLPSGQASLHQQSSFRYSTSLSRHKSYVCGVSSTSTTGNMSPARSRPSAETSCTSPSAFKAPHTAPLDSALPVDDPELMALPLIDLQRSRGSLLSTTSRLEPLVELTPRTEARVLDEQQAQAQKSQNGSHAAVASQHAECRNPQESGSDHGVVDVRNAGQSDSDGDNGPLREESRSGKAHTQPGSTGFDWSTAEQHGAAHRATPVFERCQEDGASPAAGEGPEGDRGDGSDQEVTASSSSAHESSAGCELSGSEYSMGTGSGSEARSHHDIVERASHDEEYSDTGPPLHDDDDDVVIREGSLREGDNVSDT